MLVVGKGIDSTRLHDRRTNDRPVPLVPDDNRAKNGILACLVAASCPRPILSLSTNGKRIGSNESSRVESISAD